MGFGKPSFWDRAFEEFVKGVVAFAELIFLYAIFLSAARVTGSLILWLMAGLVVAAVGAAWTLMVIRVMDFLWTMGTRRAWRVAAFLSGALLAVVVSQATLRAVEALHQTSFARA